MFNNSPILSFGSDDNHSSADEFTINFSQKSSDEFGLGYWIKSTSTCQQPAMPSYASDKSVLISKSASRIKTNDANPLPSHEKPRKSKTQNSDENCSKLPTTTIKYNNSDIPRLKIPIHVVNKLGKPRSQLINSSQYFSPKSQSSLPQCKNKKRTKRLKIKSHCHSRNDSECNSSSSFITDNSSCLAKSFEKSNDSVKVSTCSQLNFPSDDILRFTMTIDRDIYSNFSSLSRIDPVTGLLQVENRSLPTDTDPLNTRSRSSSSSLTEDISVPFAIEHNQDSLSFCCDNRREETSRSVKESDHDEGQPNLAKPDRTHKLVNKTMIVNGRKRSLDSINEDENECSLSSKRKLIDRNQGNDGAPKNESKDKYTNNITPIAFLKLLSCRLRIYEHDIFEKYCLSQPNAMKFLAQNHATKWESNINNISQLHLVPCGFLNEIFSRALYCFGLERKVLRETIMAGNQSPITECLSSHSQEFKKVCDEYSFSLKRVRYGIGVIDELFRRKANYQNIPQNNDVIVVRKWKHIIYYICLHAKSVFMAKEMEYHNYVQCSASSCSFDAAMDLCADMRHKFPKDSSKLFQCKPTHKLSPELFSQSDLEASPHSYDSGKGSSLGMFSNTNSQASACHTTSSLNSTPHSSIQEAQLHLPGFQLYRIDQYQSTANEYVRLLPEATQLHNRIVSRIGTEPNANSRDNMIKWINYCELCLEMCKSDLMNDCLERLLTQVIRL